MFEKICFAIIVLAAVLATVAVIWGLIIDFCVVGLIFSIFPLAFWGIVILAYQVWFE